MAFRSTSARYFSTFLANPETSSPPRGPPRGVINRYISLGLPPWAAWCNKVSKYSLYRMSNISPVGFLPKPPQHMDVIWLNERVRERVRTSRKVHNVYRQLKYPRVRTGVHFSDTLNHWVQVPMVESAMFQVERDGGFDNFILKRPGHELQSKYGERIRRHLLVRQKETQKNFVLQKQAEYLSKFLEEDLSKVRSSAELDEVLGKYGVARETFVKMMAKRMLRQRQRPQPVEEVTVQN